jgi:IS5 family transposase
MYILPKAYSVRQWFDLSDPGVAEALYESPGLQQFVGLDLGAVTPLDQTSLSRFRRRLENQDLCVLMLDAATLLYVAIRAWPHWSCFGGEADTP